MDVDALVALADSQVAPHVLAVLLPCLDCRWPEPRALWQTEVFFLPDRTPLDVPGLSSAGAAALLDLLVETAEEQHRAAARDEQLTLSSGERTPWRRLACR